mgnify:CR=1 FL=1|tara:strand:- start:50 stop:382 length:333 start_codon:yes stop_codon:yes gene_type:complete
MSSNLDKLKGHSDVKQDINRRKNNDINGKEAGRLNKRINDIAKVIADPDVWNVNISSRDRMDEVELRLTEVESRVRGLSYLVKRLVMNKKIEDQQLEILEEPTAVSGSDE